MRFVVTVIFAMASLVASAATGDAPDLTAYVEQARRAGMSENALSNIGTAANIIVGQVSLVFRESEPGGRWWPSFRSNACPVPGLSATQEAARQERLQQESAPIVEVLKAIADSDHSGFVSTPEGAAFRTFFEFGRLAAQVSAARGDDATAIMHAAGLDSIACGDRRAVFDAALATARTHGVDLLANEVTE